MGLIQRLRDAQERGRIQKYRDSKEVILSVALTMGGEGEGPESDAMKPIRNAYLRSRAEPPVQRPEGLLEEIAYTLSYQFTRKNEWIGKRFD